jgi:hypothetical protein
MKKLYSLMARNTNPNALIWKKALIYIKVKELVINFILADYPQLNGNINLADALQIYTDLIPGKITVSFKSKLKPLLLILRQNSVALENYLYDELVDGKVISDDSKIVVVV